MGSVWLSLTTDRPFQERIVKQLFSVLKLFVGLNMSDYIIRTVAKDYKTVFKQGK